MKIQLFIFMTNLKSAVLGLSFPEIKEHVAAGLTSHDTAVHVLSNAYTDEDDLLHGIHVFQRAMSSLNRGQRPPFKPRENTDNSNWRDRSTPSENTSASLGRAMRASTDSAPRGCHECGEMGYFVNKCPYKICGKCENKGHAT